MHKGLKIVLISIGSILAIALVVAFSGWLWLNASFLDFEDDYTEKVNFSELTIEGYTFWDRNDNQKLDIYEDNRQSLDRRVNDALSRMTVEEKIHLLKGSGMASGLGMLAPGEGIPGAVGTIVPTPRLGLPTIYLSDGPAGLRIQPVREGEDETYYCTAFPIATLLASTWNVELVNKVGQDMGDEALKYGIDVILGPGVNIHRHPLCGRNFEYYSEDPLLTGKIGAAMVNGIESNGIGTSVKHYAVNNQETNRNFNNAIVSERALREIYLKGFEIIVKESQPWTIMSSYNKVNGTYTSESEYLLTDILREDWGFEGLVMSDWFGGQNAVAQISAGNDLLEPGTKNQWDALIEGYESGELTEEAIDISGRRILKLVFSSKKMENYPIRNNPDLEGHAETTRKSASEGMILLKNENTLPLQVDNNVALFGVTSYDFFAGGTGSGDVNEAYTISLEQGLQNAGFQIDQAAKDIYNDHRALNKEAFIEPEGMNAMLEPYSPPQINYTNKQIREISKSADLAIITIGRNAGEGGDRVETDDFLLSDVEQDMIDRVSSSFREQNKEVIVVLNIGGVIETASWKSKPDAILLAWQGGQEGGNSVAEILSGEVNPSGKLPMTFPVNLDDHASNANFPLDGKPMDMMMFFADEEEKSEEDLIRNEDYTLYEEGIYVGYRHFDKKNLDVSYPFGFGLSYTDFQYSEPDISIENDTLKVFIAVTNIGKTTGKEVVQLYVSRNNSNVDRPEKELKAFNKTGLLKPGDSEIIQLLIPITDLSYWNEKENSWSLENGLYQIRIGASSRDIRASGDVEI